MVFGVCFWLFLGLVFWSGLSVGFGVVVVVDAVSTSWVSLDLMGLQSLESLFEVGFA